MHSEDFKNLTERHHAAAGSPSDLQKGVCTNDKHLLMKFPVC